MDGDLGLRLGVEAGHVLVVMVLAGQYYDQTTGVTTYRPENVEGNWQTYFFDFHSMPIDKKRQLMLDNYMHGDYTCNVDINRSSSARLLPEGRKNGLSHVNNYYLENRLTLNYTIGNLTLGLPTYIEYRHTDNREGTIDPINAVNFQYGLTANYNIKRDSESHALRWLQGHSTKTVFFRRKNLFIMQIFYTFAPVFEGHSILSDSEKCLLTEKAKNYLYQPLKIL